MRLLPSFLRRSVISERRLAQDMQRSDRFDRNFKKKLLCLFLKQLIAKIWKRLYSTLNRQPAILTHFPHLFFNGVLNCLEVGLLEVVNISLLSGIFPKSLKTAVVKPLLKKSNLDNTILSNYRPMSNLPFIGKIIEKVVFNQPNN